MAALSHLGCFDEESCRYFLREVGARVVPNYPFSFGMEEVYSLIIENYGYEGIPDVTSVLEELLEDDDTATGIGDDGDIWRSWRHYWRHRNDDALNPFIPKVGNFVLQHPTSKAIRRIKADNFLRNIENEQSRHHHTESSATSTSQRPSYIDITPRSPTVASRSSMQNQIEPATLLTTATYSHQRCRLKLPSQRKNEDEVQRDSEPAALRNTTVDSITTSSDSQQDFADVIASMLETGFDAGWVLSFEMLEPGESLNRVKSSVKSGRAPVCTLQPISSEPSTPAPDAELVKAGTCHKSSDTGDVSLRRSREVHSEEMDFRNLEFGPEEAVEPCEADRLCDSGPENQISQETSNEHYYSNHSCVTPAETPEPQRRRTANRHARLIDGAIFPFKGRKSSAARSSVDVQEAVTPHTGRRSLFRLSWTPTRQNSESRHSWLQGVRSFFRASQNKPSKFLSEHRHSSSIGNVADARLSMSISHKRGTSNTAVVPQSRQQPNLGLCLDGTWEPSPSPSSSPLNKPLPLTPDEIANSLASQARSSSNARSQSLSNQPQSASTISTTISQTSSKQAFRALTKELVVTKDLSMPYPELSPVHETRLDPNKYDPEKSPRPSYSPALFSTLAQRNPYADDLVPLTPRPTNSIDAQSNPSARSYESNGLPPSQSAPNLRPWSPIRMPHAAYYSPPNLPQTPPPSSPVRSRSIQESSRGRSKSCLRTEEGSSGAVSNGTGSPHKQAKRSRSPVKRLLGIGKSTPMKESEVEVHAEPKTPTAASSSKKRSLKQWSDRIRHGFLTLDQEEQREAQIDEYMEDTAPPEPPSTFPISLDPAYQARLQADVELLLCVSANKFLLGEAREGRISKDSIHKVRRSWESKNQPQVLEYHFDQATQRELILANFRTVQFHGPVATDPIALNSAMLSWGTMAKEMSIRTFCSADSAIKKQLHDAQRVLEMLGAPLVTCLAFESLHVKALATMTKRQKERLARKKTENGGHTRNTSNVSKASQKGPYPRRDYSDASNWIPHHRRNLSEGSFGVIRGVEEESVEDKIRRMNVTPAPPPQIKMRKNTRANGAVLGMPGRYHSPTHNSSPSPSRHGRGYGDLRSDVHARAMNGAPEWHER